MQNEQCILVVEDQPEVIESITEILEFEGFNVIAASNGKKALEFLEKTSPDLIISDIMMPQLNGYEFKEYLQKKTELASIPFIFLSAKISDTDIRKGMNLGADDYLKKPFDVQDLIDIVNTKIRKNQLWKKEMENIRDSFALAVPHHLRTPLIPIMGYSDMYLNNPEDFTTKDVTEFFTIIKDNAVKLRERINKFILCSSIQVELKDKVHLRDLSKEVTDITDADIEQIIISEASRQKRQGDLSFNLSGARILFPQLMLTYCVKELIENSFKYSPAGTNVIVTGEIKRNKYCLSFYNNGTGFGKDELKTIGLYNKFHESIFNSGSGIGLYIVMLIIRKMNSRIIFESEFGYYAKVSLLFKTA